MQTDVSLAVPGSTTAAASELLALAATASTSATSFTTPLNALSRSDYTDFVTSAQFLGFTEALLKTAHNMLNGYLTAFFVVTGIVSNVFSIYIFLRCERGGTPAIQYYLVALTVWQTALLANAFLLYSLPLLLFDGDIYLQGDYVYIYPYVYTFANTTHTGSVWIVLTLTIDRYLALCQPLKHRAIGKRSRVKRLMIMVSVLAALFSAPRFFEVHVTLQYDNITQTEYATVARTSLFDNHLYWTVYHVILATIFVTLCPCLLLFALTVRISFALRKAIAKRKSLCAPNPDMDNRKKSALCQKKEHKANIMLVLVIAKFLISDILPTVIDVLEQFVGSTVFGDSAWASLFVDLSNFLLVLNCSSNFWVFLIWGKRFRQSSRRLLLSCRLGIALYTVFNGSAPDLVSICGPASLTTVQQTTIRGYGGERSIRRKMTAGACYNEVRLVTFSRFETKEAPTGSRTVALPTGRTAASGARKGMTTTPYPVRKFAWYYLDSEGKKAVDAMVTVEKLEERPWKRQSLLEGGSRVPL